MAIDTSGFSSAIPSILIYGVVMLVVTFVALFTKGWSKTTIIILLICWVPWLLFSVAVLLLFVTVQVLVAMLVVGGAVLLVIVVWILLFKFLDRWRN